MQFHVSFKIEGMCIRQSLLDTILRILLGRFLVSFTNRLVYSGIKMKSTLRLKLFKKIDKNTCAGFKLLTSIYG